MIIGHRGARGYAPENTIPSIEKAFSLGADGIEIDVQMSCDGKIYLYHDWTIEKTAGVKRLFTDLSSSEISRIDSGVWFSEEYRGLKIPCLEEALSAVPPGKIINIEIKKRADDNREIEEKIISLVKNMDLLHNTVISSSNHRSILKISRIDESVKTALVLSQIMTDPEEYFKKFSCYSIHPAAYCVDLFLIKTVHQAGMKLFTWTVNVPVLAKVLAGAGCDGIITDYPDLLEATPD